MIFGDLTLDFWIAIKLFWISMGVLAIYGVYKIISGLSTSYLDIKTQKYIDDVKQIKQINDKLREKSGLIQGIKILRQDIETNQNATSINDNGNVSVFNGEEEVEYENVLTLLPEQYSGKELTSAQKGVITRFLNGYKFYNLNNFDSIDDLLNLVSTQNGEKEGLKQYISKILNRYGIEMTDDLIPNE